MDGWSCLEEYQKTVFTLGILSLLFKLLLYPNVPFSVQQLCLAIISRLASLSMSVTGMLYR